MGSGSSSSSSSVSRVSPIGGELRQAEDGRAAGALGLPVARAGREVRQGALVAQGGEAVDGAGADDVEPARPLEQIDEHVERRGLPGATQRARRLGLDEVALVAQGVAA